MARANFMPGRYRGVSVAQVDFFLDEANLRAHFLGREAYRRTRFIVARRAEEIGGTVECISPLTAEGGTRFVVRFRGAG